MHGTARSYDRPQEHTPRDAASISALLADVAQLRSVMRHATRLIDERARHQGVDPLEHQLLIQLFGAPDDHTLTVNRLSQRLDIAPAMGSRLARRLEERGLVERLVSERDRRVTNVRLAPLGRALCVTICEDVRWRIVAASRDLEDDTRRRALDAFAYYLGTALDDAVDDPVRD